MDQSVAGVLGERSVYNLLVFLTVLLALIILRLGHFTCCRFIIKSARLLLGLGFLLLAAQSRHLPLEHVDVVRRWQSSLSSSHCAGPVRLGSHWQLSRWDVVTTTRLVVRSLPAPRTANSHTGGHSHHPHQPLGPPHGRVLSQHLVGGFGESTEGRLWSTFIERKVSQHK